MKKLLSFTLLILSISAFGNDCHVIARNAAFTYALHNDYAESDSDFDWNFPIEENHVLYENGSRPYMIWAWGDSHKVIVVNLSLPGCNVREVYLSQDDQD